MGGLNLPWRVVPQNEGPNAELIDEYKIVDASGNDLFQDAGSYTIEGSVARKEVADFIVRVAVAAGEEVGMGRLESLEKIAELAVADAREDLEIARVRLAGAEKRLAMAREHRKIMEGRTNGQEQASTEAAS